MPRKKKTPVDTPAIDLPQDFLEKLIPGPMDAAGVEAVFQRLKKAVIERALGAELGLHLADEGGQGNHRNGRSGKTVLTDDGPLRIAVPREELMVATLTRVGRRWMLMLWDGQGQYLATEWHRSRKQALPRLLAHCTALGVPWPAL